MKPLYGSQVKPGQRLLFGAVLVLSLSISACHSPGNSSVHTSTEPVTIEEERLIYGKKIAAMAEELDHGFEDGWICGRNTRVHKSGYKDVDPNVKAEFALAYQEMINKTSQNLAVDIDSYVPYSKRFEFALNWWRHSKAGEAFEKESVKKKIVWVHESLLDGSELFWRVYELQHPGQVNSVAVMAHDKEQDMVFNYMEREGEQGTFSKLYKKWFSVLDKSG